MLSGKLHLAAHVMLATQSVNSYSKHYGLIQKCGLQNKHFPIMNRNISGPGSDVAR